MTVTQPAPVKKLPPYIRIAQVYQNVDTQQWYLQICACHSHAVVDTDWQLVPELGSSCYTPTVDIQDELIPCDSEEQAIQLMAQHYCNELRRLGKGDC